MADVVPDAMRCDATPPPSPASFDATEPTWDSDSLASGDAHQDRSGSPSNDFHQPADQGVKTPDNAGCASEVVLDRGAPPAKSTSRSTNRPPDTSKAGRLRLRSTGG
ncbi:hypothetical protein O9K51_07778 [Purpureocillium lavendulum]|uniref:Uncharacterized protein n=1 Tax=Purpureocillium lavendulum TaxID=1247861 RepID=A0AB34FL95_9HYPO|nr:hypothetical protein O9K51_07778 [Purpureocillium lavendulum]